MTRNRFLGGFAVVFGLMTLFSGGMVLFGPTDARAAAGAVVPLVLWFNFASGFLYVIAGIGIFLSKSWGRLLAWLIVGALVVVMGAFGWHVLGGAPWETRTLGALTLRLVFWIVVASLARARATTGPGDRPADGLR
ncbi:hypothetical protein [Salinarimonas ramus]|uniref:Uncharacterized protein n=1 Tax=Salinarimonas ramus TaxID=690164 RepID=A0A917QHP1_9HYPH|nr:hypothetical protein [Salinarimonas ramus]GGK51088.1 hypothetical protein GCM10011322_42700 [Salinarimonas ramus]